MSNLKKTSPQRAAKGQLKIVDHISFTPPFWTLAGVLLIIAAVFCVYLPSINGSFIIDDDTLVSESKIIKAADGLARIWSSEKTVDFWPATNTTFWIEWRLWKMHPSGYHATNLILHVAEAFLIWLILRKLAIPGAFLAALVFALHPVNVESVAWISSRKNLTAMLFFLLSIYWYLKTVKLTATQTAKNHPEDNHREAASGFPHPSSFILHASSFHFWYWLSLAAFLLAMLGKGSAAVMPVLLLGITWWFRPVSRRDLVWTAPFFLVAVVLVVVNMWFQTHGSGEPYHIATLTESLLGAGGVIWFYLYKALMPVDLAFIYPQWKIATGNPLWWLPLSAAVAVTLVLWLCRKGWGRSLLFSWGFFCVALLPVMGFADVGFMQYSLVANRQEHIAVIAVIAMALAPFCIWHGRTRGALRWIASGIAVVAIAILAFFTWRESGLYHDEFKLYQVTLEKNPSSWMAHNNWGLALDKAGRTEEAIAHYRRALALKPDYPEAHNNWGLALNKTGRGEEAIGHFQRALDIKPDYFNAHNNWGIALDKMGRFREAVDHYKLALELTTDNPEIYNNLGASLIQMGRPEEAISECEHALAIDPDYAQAHSTLASALMQTNRVREAIEHYKQALKLQPDYADAYINLGGALVKAGRFQEAVDYCRQALEIDPHSAEAHNTMGSALQALGRNQEAVEQYEAALESKTDTVKAHINLGSALVQMGKIPQAIEHYRQALLLKPDSIEAYNNLGNALQSIGQYPQAIEHFESALRLNPKIAQVHTNLAFALAHAGRFSEAIEHYRQALRLNPELTHVYLNMALIYSKNKQSSEAIEIAQKGLEQARSKGETELARDIESWLNSYRAGLRDIPKEIPDARSAAPTP